MPTAKDGHDDPRAPRTIRELNKESTQIISLMPDQPNPLLDPVAPEVAKKGMKMMHHLDM